MVEVIQQTGMKVFPKGGQAAHPEWWQAVHPEWWQAAHPEWWQAKVLPEWGQAKKGNTGNIGNTGENNQLHAKTDEDTDISMLKQVITDLNLLIANVSSSVQTDFDTVVLEVFPDIASDCHFRVNKELCESGNISFGPQNTLPKQSEELHKDVTAQYELDNDLFDTCSVNDVVCYQAIRSSETLWNANDLVFGSFHQNDVRFSEQSRGYQCTCNALCMLSYALSHMSRTGHTQRI